jgi:penicillin amidase
MFRPVQLSFRKLSVCLLLAPLFVLTTATALAEDFNFPGLTGTVTVYEDQYGIPSIKGDSQLDVMFVQGYIQARDRFFQMDYDRKLAAGRLSELLGASALSTDVQFRTIGLGRAALKSWQALEPDSKAWAQAYANGVNTYLANNPLPPEHTLLEITEVEPWTPLHTLLHSKLLAASFSLFVDDTDFTITLGTYAAYGDAIGFDGQALFFEDTHRSAPGDDRVTAPGFLGSIGGIDQASTEAAGSTAKTASGIEYTGNREVSEKMLELALKVREKFDSAPLLRQRLQNMQDPRGSNAWLVSGKYTESGHAMIANDPHLSLNTPSIFYENHLIFNKDGEEWHVNGIAKAGAPGVVLGCNNFTCWGATVNPLDVTDFFFEEFQTNALGLPVNSMYKGNPEPMQLVFNSWFVNVVGDEIPNNLVRANVGYTEGAITFVIPRRNDGPVVSSDASGTSGISMMYSGFRATHEFSAIKGFDLAGSLEEFTAAIQKLDISVQNVYYADVEGSIAWFTSSEKPMREDLAAFTVDGLPPWFIRDGTGAMANEWLPVMNPQPDQALDYEILPFNEMPQLVNPEKGFITNANNDPIGVSLDNNPVNQVRAGGTGLYYLNAGYASYRMGRVDREIKAMIESGDPISVEDFERLQANVKLLDAELVLPTVLAIMAQVPVPPGTPMAQALDVLSSWDYSTHTGISEGWDAGDDPLMTSEPDAEEIRHAAAATVWAMWRSMLVQNTINATLTAYGLGDVLPPSKLAYTAFKHHLENYPTAAGVGASGINFFSQGLAETVAGSLQMALDRLASDEFAPAFANSSNVLDYSWGKLHRIVLDHAFNQDPFNVPNGGGFSDLAADLPGLSRQGGFEAVDASTHSPTADTLNGFMFGSGPSRRFIAEMYPTGPVAQEVLAGGQSGVFYDPNYSSQLPKWLTNEYHPMALGSQDAENSAVSMITFGPGQ